MQAVTEQFATDNVPICVAPTSLSAAYVRVVPEAIECVAEICGRCDATGGAIGSRAEDLRAVFALHLFEAGRGARVQARVLLAVHTQFFLRQTRFRHGVRCPRALERGDRRTRLLPDGTCQ